MLTESRGFLVTGNVMKMVGKCSFYWLLNLHSRVLNVTGCIRYARTFTPPCMAGIHLGPL